MHFMQHTFNHCHILFSCPAFFYLRNIFKINCNINLFTSENYSNVMNFISYNKLENSLIMRSKYCNRASYYVFTNPLICVISVFRLSTSFFFKFSQFSMIFNNFFHMLGQFSPIFYLFFVFF